MSTRIVYARIVLTKRKTAAPHLCVCFGVAIFVSTAGTTAQEVLAKGNGEENQTREHIQRAVRLESVSCRARQTD